MDLNHTNLEQKFDTYCGVDRFFKLEQIDDFVDELVPLEDRRATGAFRKQLARHLSKKVFKTALGNSEFEANK